MRRLTLLLFSFFLLALGGLFLLPAPSEGAMRIVLKDGDLYTISEALGEKRLTTKGDIKFIFEKKNQHLLVGKGIKHADPAGEATPSTDLILMSDDGLRETSIADGVLRAAFNRKGDKVLFNTRELDLYLSNPDGSGKIKIQEKADKFEVDPTDRRIAYQKLNSDWKVNEYYDRALGIAVMDLETGKETLLSQTADDFNPFWTPSGQKILFFSSSPEGLASHFIMNPDGSERTQLTNHEQVYVTDQTIPIPSEKPIWSKDGRFLVYESDREIWVNEFDADHTRVVRSQHIGYGKDPQWIADGKLLSIVVAKSEKSKAGLITVDLLGNVQK